MPALTDKVALAHADMLLGVLADPCDRLLTSAQLQQGMASAPPAQQGDLSAAQCASLLKELLARYADPGLRAQLAQVRSTVMGLDRMAALLLSVQAPVLAKCCGWLSAPVALGAHTGAPAARFYPDATPTRPARLSEFPPAGRRLLGGAGFPVGDSNGVVGETLLPPSPERPRPPRRQRPPRRHPPPQAGSAA